MSHEASPSGRTAGPGERGEPLAPGGSGNPGGPGEPEGPAPQDSGRGLSRRVLGVVVVLLGMGLAGAAGGYIVLLLTMRGREVVVPDLLRMTQSEAEAEAARRGLMVAVAGTRIEPRVGEGRVFEQDPQPGARTRPGREVRVLLSLGQGSLDVPSLTGAPLRKVRLSLEQMGLRVGTLAYVPAFDAPADQVLGQRPAPGARRQKGDAVNLLVSRGAPERVFVMPALTGLSLERARTLLGDVGVRVGLSRRDTPAGVSPGVVIDQRPAEGFPLKERQTAQLTVGQ